MKTHLTLRDLRPVGTTKRAIPYGYGFNLVSCPNYFFESAVWFAIAALSGSYTGEYCALLTKSISNFFLRRLAWFFYVFATYIMFNWAVKRHRAYKKEFGTAYPKRKVMFPFIY